MDAVGNAQEGSSEDKVGAIGEIGTADVRGRDPTGGSCMSDNVPRPEMGGGGLVYWVR